MKRYVLALAMAAAYAASAHIAAPSGALARAAAYAETENYQAVLDELATIDTSVPGTVDAAEYAWLHAEALYRSARFAEALPELQRFAMHYAASPHAPAALLHAADCIMAIEGPEAALEAYRAVDGSALSRSDRGELALRTGLCMMQTGRTAEAAAQFAAAAEVPESRSAANFYRGVLAFNEHDYAAARRYFGATDTSRAPGDKSGVYLSQIYFAEASYTQALEASRRALMLPQLSNDERASLERVAGESLARMGRTQEGLPYLRRYIGMSTAPAPSALYIVGAAEYASGNYTEACRLLEPASAGTDETAQSASLLLGQALHHLGNNDAAIMAFDRALRAGSSDPSVREAAYYNYAVAKFAGGNVPFGSAVTTFEAFLDEYPSGPYSDSVRRYLADGYVAEADYARALERIDAIRNPSPQVEASRQYILYVLANQALTAGDADRALNLLSRTRQGASDTDTGREIILTQARAYAAKGDNSRAERLFNDYLRRAGNSTNRPQAYYGLGYARFGQRNYDAAATAFRSALDSGVFTGAVKADIYNRLGDIAYYGSDFAAAGALYGQAYDADPASGDYAAFNGARMLGFARDYEGKLDALATFRSRFPSSSLMPDALLETTQAQLSLGRRDEAVDTYRALIAAYPLTAQGRRGYIQLAMTLLEKGDREGAIDAYKEVVSRYPSSEEAAQAASLLRSIYADAGRGDEYLAFMQSVDGVPAVDRSDAAELTYNSALRVLNESRDTAPMQRFLEEYPDAQQAEDALAAMAGVLYASDCTPEAMYTWQALAQRASTPAMATKAQMGILRAARDMGDSETAGAAAQAILDSSAATPQEVNEATFSAALFASESGQPDRAIDMWQSIAGSTDDLYGAKSAYYVAETLFGQSRLEEALEAAMALTSSRTPHQYWIARAFILQSDILVRQDKKFEAREYLRALDQNYPGNETDIREMIEERLSQL